MNNNVSDLWDQIIEEGIATQEELELVTSINGYNTEALNDIIYARTGYHSIEQMNEEDEEDEE